MKKGAYITRSGEARRTNADYYSDLVLSPATWRIESGNFLSGSNWREDRQWRSLLSNDISQAIEQLVDHPEQTPAILRVLNNRLRPLGVRLELTDGDRLRGPEEVPLCD